MKKLFGLPVLLFILSILWVRPALAQQPTPSDDAVNAVARQLYCPVCENTPLDVCPTQACHDWRELIRQMLADGKSTDEIKQYFVDHYGARVLAEPPRTGINWLVYIVPPVLFLAGMGLLIVAFISWRRMEKVPAGEAGPGSHPTVANAEYIRRLEEELKQRK
jgi:cytochrome c-type biogenesis protein CcmH